MAVFKQVRKQACKHAYVKAHKERNVLCVEVMSHSRRLTESIRLWETPGGNGGQTTFTNGARVVQQPSCKLKKMYASLFPHSLCLISVLAYCIIGLEITSWVSC